MRSIQSLKHVMINSDGTKTEISFYDAYYMHMCFSQEIPVKIEIYDDAKLVGMYNSDINQENFFASYEKIKEDLDFDIFENIRPRQDLSVPNFSATQEFKIVYDFSSKTVEISKSRGKPNSKGKFFRHYKNDMSRHFVNFDVHQKRLPYYVVDILSIINFYSNQKKWFYYFWGTKKYIYNADIETIKADLILNISNGDIGSIIGLKKLIRDYKPKIDEEESELLVSSMNVDFVLELLELSLYFQKDVANGFILNISSAIPEDFYYLVQRILKRNNQ